MSKLHKQIISLIASSRSPRPDDAEETIDYLRRGVDDSYFSAHVQYGDGTVTLSACMPLGRKGPLEVKVNWSAIGSQKPEVALAWAKQLARVSRLALRIEALVSEEQS